MTDLIHFGILITSLASIGVGLWMMYPAAMFVGEGLILLALLCCARSQKERHANTDADRS